MAKIIELRDSNICHLPIITTRPAQVGDRLIFTGKVQVTNFHGRTCEKPIFTDLNTNEEVVMSVSAMMKAKGTISFLLKNFDTVFEVLSVARGSKVIFNIVADEISTKRLPSGEQIRVRNFTIDCEN